MQRYTPLLKGIFPFLLQLTLVWLAGLWMPLAAVAQLQEDFSDSNFHQQPVWYGSDTDWFINDQHQLQSNNTSAGATFSISTGNTLATSVQWEWYMRLHFNTSSANYTDVFLVADSANLQAPGNAGYVVRIGDTKDNISLYRKDKNGTSTLLINGSSGVTNHSDNPLKVKVVHDGQVFTLYSDATGSGNQYRKEGSATDSTYTSSAYFGIVIKQSTGSFFQKHYFDDISIQPYVRDSLPPRVQSVSVTDSTVAILFSEPVEAVSSQLLSNYKVDRGMDEPVKADTDPQQAAAVYLTFSKPFTGGNYTLTVKGVQDITGNPMADTTISFSYSVIQGGDMVINEILYNPKPNGSDYIELYNRSAAPVDISSLYLANRNSAGAVASLKKITDSSYIVAPGNYVVLTADADALLRDYLVKDRHTIVVMPSMPSYPDKEGTVVLTNKQGVVIDDVHYTDSWQFALLTSTEGVSLERVDPDKPSQQKDNWQSAAASAGYGTPGYKNSQYKQEEATAHIEVVPTTFSPDGDGKDDVAMIHYQLPATGYVATVTIFNAAGKPVRYLVKNELAGVQGSWLWDGFDEKGNKLATGTYIVYVELFNLQGNKMQYKKAVVLARRY